MGHLVTKSKTGSRLALAVSILTQSPKCLFGEHGQETAAQQRWCPGCVRPQPGLTQAGRKWDGQAGSLESRQRCRDEVLPSG